MINEDKRCNNLTGKEWLQNSFSIWRDLTKTKQEKDLKHPASYPVALCEKLIQTFSKEGGSVLDPFNGIGSSMVAAHNLNRSGTGIDLSEEFCEIARDRTEGDSNIRVIHGDSFLELDKLESNSFDICITSPPYWDILNRKRSADKKETVNYSDKENDLGNILDYDEFITLLGDLFSKVYRVLKDDKYCIVNVMDIRKKSDFYPLHSDLATELKKRGFLFDDLIIWDRQNEYNNMRPLGYPYKYRINKVHEYLLIFIKERGNSMFYEEMFTYLQELQKSKSPFFIEIEGRPDTIQKFIASYNGSFSPNITMATDGVIVLQSDANKWGKELRLYVEKEPPASLRKFFTKNKDYRANYNYRMNDNNCIQDLFMRGFRIGQN